MKQKNILIVFTKNLLHGKVKTRLAATVGNDRAFTIYKELIAHTHTITKKVSFDKIVYYSDYIQPDDIWDNGYFKAKQYGVDLGERMMNAFCDVFQQCYSKAIIIGTDCPSLTEKIIADAITQLNQFDIVIGPAKDGGYYLLGMKKLSSQLFANIDWSTGFVLGQTIAVCKKESLSYQLLPELSDVDTEKDI